MTYKQRGQLQRAKGGKEALEHILSACCRRELTSGGREHVNKLLTKYDNDINRIENEAGSSSNG